MDIRDFLEELTVKCKNKVPDLNRGGCAIYAKLLSDELDKRNIVHHFCVEDPTFYDKPEQSRYYSHKMTYKQLTGYHLTAWHIAIKVKRKMINGDDCTHVVPKSLNHIMRQNIISTYRIDRELYDEVGEDGYDYFWNTCFHENHRNIPKLKQIIKSEFKKYDLCLEQ